MLNEPTIINQTLNKIKLKKHPDKTFIGRIGKGFDFLGYSFEPKGLSIAPKTLAKFLECKTQLYMQCADVRRIGQYIAAKNDLLVFLFQHPRGCIPGCESHISGVLLKDGSLYSFIKLTFESALSHAFL